MDDVGTYRCISAAVLPVDSENHNHPTNPNGFAVRSGSEDGSVNENDGVKVNRNFPTNSESPPIYEFDSGEASNEEILLTTTTKNPKASRYFKNSRKMKFPATTKKLRFTRETESSADQFPTATGTTNFEMSSQEDASSYDPFFASGNTQPNSNYLPRNGYYSPNNYYHNSYPEQPIQNSYRHLSNPYTNPDFQSYSPNLSNNNYLENPPISQPNQYYQDNRHLPQHGYGPHYPGFGYGPTTTPYPVSHPPTTPFGLQIPYYKPSYSSYTVYQEIVFNPSGITGRFTTGPSPPYPYPGK